MHSSIHPSTHSPIHPSFHPPIHPSIHRLFINSFRGSTAEETTQNVVNEQIPAISSLCEAGDLLVHNIDVFCEKGVFDTDQSRRILMAGKKAGWRINFHGDELHPMNSGEV